MRPLLTIDESGSLRLVDVETGARVLIGDDHTLDPPRQAVTAVWSGVGQWTAWASTDGVPGGAHELRLHDEATDSARTIAEFVDAFYLNASPCGRYLAHLSNGPLGLELAYTDIARGEHHVVERGQPLFWAWSSDSDRIAVHAGRRMLVHDLASGESELLAHDVGAFTAPRWLPGGSVLGVVNDCLVAFGPDGAKTEVVDGLGPQRFTISSDGRLLALVAPGGVRVIDLITALERPVADFETVTGVAQPHSPVGAFWSPDATALAVLVQGPDHEVRWIVDQHDGCEALPSFTPGPVWYQTVLPFFEQFAVSHRHWSADSTQLVAPGLRPGIGEGGAVIHTLGSGDELWIPGAATAWWADEDHG